MCGARIPGAGRWAGDLRHHAAAGVRDRAQVRLGRAARQRAPRAQGADGPALSRRAGIASLVDRRPRPRGTGLVAVLHSWETGSDNSPAWDAALARVPTTTSTPIRRKDTSHVEAVMRPKGRRLPALDPPGRHVPQLPARTRNGNGPSRRSRSPRSRRSSSWPRATEDLAALSSVLGNDREADELGDMRRRLTGGLIRQWRAALGRFVSHDLVTGRDIEHSDPRRLRAAACPGCRWPDVVSPPRPS